MEAFVKRSGCMKTIWIFCFPQQVALYLHGLHLLQVEQIVHTVGLYNSVVKEKRFIMSIRCGFFSVFWFTFLEPHLCFNLSPISLSSKLLDLLFHYIYMTKTVKSNFLSLSFILITKNHPEWNAEDPTWMSVSSCPHFMPPRGRQHVSEAL